MSQLLSCRGPQDAAPDTKTVAPRNARDVVVGRQSEVLQDIALPGVAAAIWQRKPDAAFQDWIDSLVPEQLPELRIVVPVNQIEGAVRVACDNANTPTGLTQDWFARDVGLLARAFSDILEVDHVQIRLDIAFGKMCPSFHRDNVPARLLCTYRGPGTEYVPERHQDDPHRIRRMNTGSVELFRGSRWSADEPCGLLHRSPPVKAGFGPRLLLVIDRSPQA